jgi:phosphatidylserine/phosphatidylglycerophosphate/cardiolipin synthase-like enzyme
MHIKAAMIDDIYTMYGSTNWTTAGFDSNNETFVNITSPDVAEDFQALFDLDWNDYSYVAESEGVGKWLISTVTEIMDWGF